jgi:hypothetical protein
MTTAEIGSTSRSIASGPSDLRASGPSGRPAPGPDRVGAGERRPRPWVTPAAFAVLGVGLFLAFLAEAQKLPIFADGSSQALQAWDIAHGNVLLHGWVLSDVSFYTTELPQYLLIERVLGLNPVVVHVAAAMTYAMLVVAAAVLAKGRATGREGLVRVLIAAGIMLAPPFGRILYSRGYSPAWVLLSAPDHTGTQIPLVLTWLVLDRMRPRWWLPILVAVMLTWVEIADPTAIFEGALPIVVVCGVRLYRRRGPLAGQWYDLSLAVGAAASAALATGILALIKAVGGFTVNPASPVLTTVDGLTANFWVKVHNILVLFGADFFGLHATSAVIPIAHLVAVVLVGWAVVRAARRFFADDDLAVQVMTASFVLLLAEFVLGYRTGAREAVGLLPIGAALAGRMLAERVVQLRLAAALAAVLTFFSLELIVNVFYPALPSPDQPLASWLQAHHLTYGLSDTWFASNGVTLYSEGRVRVRDVKIAPDGNIERLLWNTDASWYEPRLNDARFIIFSPCAVKRTGRLFEAAGRPSATYFVDGFTVLVWKSNLLASHPGLASASAQGRAGPPGRTRISGPGSTSYLLMCG